MAVTLFERIQKIEKFLENKNIPTDMRSVWQNHLIALHRKRIQHAKRRNMESKIFKARLVGNSGEES